MFQTSAADYVKYTNNKSWSEKKISLIQFQICELAMEDCKRLLSKRIVCVSMQCSFQFPCRKGHIVWHLIVASWVESRVCVKRLELAKYNPRRFWMLSDDSNWVMWILLSILVANFTCCFSSRSEIVWNIKMNGIVFVYFSFEKHFLKSQL